MASNPGILSDWPWKPLGSFKYLILAPWVVRGTYSYLVKGKDEGDLGYFLIFPFLLSRMIHDQIWISLSRYRTAKGKNRIVDKGIEFGQVDRESNWDDQILLNGMFLYVGYHLIYPRGCHLPIWRTDGVILTTLLHAGPVEFLYYWLHRALHHHYLYSRYHSHHHSSIVTEPITSVIHPFAEHIAYFLLFAIPMVTTLMTNTASIACFAGYIIYIDFMNNMGHCNFEHIPKSLFSVFPPLKYLMYTPSYHSLHHTQFRTNYCLFMPIYDCIYNTMDKSSDVLHEISLRRDEESPDVVNLVHLTTLESIYHLQVGFASWASKPYSPKWYLWVLWPVTLWTTIVTWAYGRTFVSERFSFKSLKSQSWVVPRYKIQYSCFWLNEAINSLIEEAIAEADAIGVKVLSLGLLNQGEELNRNGELYVQKNPRLKIKLVDGSSLAVGVVLNSIPEGTTQVLIAGKLTKVARALAIALRRKGIQVATLSDNENKKLELGLATSYDESNVMCSSSCNQKIWLVGDGLTDEEQWRAPKGALFIPISQFPPRKVRRDCFYNTTPAMIVPKSFENLHSCENWLPRRVMSAWRIAGILHALEGWNVHECGHSVFDVQKVWQASLNHGFRPLTNIASPHNSIN